MKVGWKDIKYIHEIPLIRNIFRDLIDIYMEVNMHSASIRVVKSEWVEYEIQEFRIVVK